MATAGGKASRADKRRWLLLSSSRRRGAVAAAEPPDPGTLLADYVIVPCFDEKWGPSWKAVLRAAGADLPDRSADGA